MTTPEIGCIRALAQAFIEDADRELERCGPVGAHIELARAEPCRAIVTAIDALPGPAVPPAIQAGIDRYAQHGIPPGSCLRAILEGDLFAAFTCADPGTRTAMGAIVDKITSTLHASVFGSPEAVSRYIAICQKLREASDKPFTGSDR